MTWASSWIGRSRARTLSTGGGLALAPHPGYLSISLGKADIRAVAQGLFDGFRGRGLHVAAVTVARFVNPVPDRQAIADAFWTLHAQPRKARTVGTILKPTGA